MNKKIIFGVVTLAVIGGVSFYMWKKKQGANDTSDGGSNDKTDSSEPSFTPTTFVATADAKGNGKGKWLAVPKTSDRKIANALSVGDKVQVDGTETTITKIYKDKNKNSGAFQFENGVVSGSKMGW